MKSCIVSIRAVMEIEKLFAPEVVEEECVVVIDVLRAFTTAAYAFAAGAERLIPVASVEEAFLLKKRFPEALLMGELHGIKVDGFDFGNSPNEFLDRDLKGRTLIQRTGAGTVGLVRAQKSKFVMASSFVVAEATLRHILELQPQKVTFVITGRDRADEDLALADYLEDRLMQKSVDSSSYLRRITDSSDAQFFFEKIRTYPADIRAAMAIDRFGFSMKMQPKDGVFVVRCCEAV